MRNNARRYALRSATIRRAGRAGRVGGRGGIELERGWILGDRSGREGFVRVGDEMVAKRARRAEDGDQRGAQVGVAPQRHHQAVTVVSRRVPGFAWALGRVRLALGRLRLALGGLGQAAQRAQSQIGIGRARERVEDIVGAVASAVLPGRVP